MKRGAIRIAALAVLIASCADTPNGPTSIDRQASVAGETITVTKGDLQLGLPNVALPKNLRFIVRTAGGAPIVGARGTIAVTSGGGSVNNPTFKTTSTGEFTFSWTLGASGAQAVTITMNGTGATTQATAVVVPVGSDLQITAGNGQSGAPGDTLGGSIRVKLVDPSNNPIPGVTVQFTAQHGGGVRNASVRTNATGFATNFWKLGWGAQTQNLVAKVPGVDSVVFNATAVTTGMTLSIVSGNNQSGTPNTLLAQDLVVVLRNASNQPIQGAEGTVSVALGGGSLNRSTVTTNSLGRAVAKWTLGAAGTQRMMFKIGAVDSVMFDATLPAGCTSVAVGATAIVNGSTFCLEGGVSGAEFTLIGTNVGTAAVPVTFTASNIAAVTGLPSPNLVPGSSRLSLAKPMPNEKFELGLRQREKSVLDQTAPQFHLARPSSNRPNLNIVPGVPAIGATMSLNVQAFSSCGTPVLRTATVKAVSAHLILMEDNTNPAGGFSAAEYAAIAAEFESRVWNTNIANFGTPSDIDANSRVVALYTAAVNDLTPAGTAATQGFVGGFFYGRDLLSTASCAGSNQGEMFYMLAPDPTGARGNTFLTADVLEGTVGTLAHEFQHLVNSSRRSAAGFAQETVWLNEGLSHIAEELAYYNASGRTPGQNINASNITANQTELNAYVAYAQSNIARFWSWLEGPGFAGPFSLNDNLNTRGAIWAFLRYAGDRKGGTQSTLWNALTSSPETGVANLSARLGVDANVWLHDWSKSVYTDDVTDNTNPSWNLRHLFTAYSTPYPLATGNPVADTPLNNALSGGGGSAYVRFRVPAGMTAAITTTAPTATLKATLYRRN